MRRVVFGVLGFLGGAIAGWLLSMAAYIILSSTGLLVDRDGGAAMGFAFTIGPLAALLLGVAGAVLASRRR